MKRFFACICLFFAAVMILTACSPRFNAAVYEDVHIDESLGFESRAFLLKNTGDIEAHIEAHETDEFSKPYYGDLKKYDSKFFEENSLAVVYYYDSTTSAKISVKGIQYSGDTVTVILSRKAPKIVTDAVKECVIFVEIPKGEKITSADLKVS